MGFNSSFKGLNKAESDWWSPWWNKERKRFVTSPKYSNL